jgi:chromosome segregation ATPase
MPTIAREKPINATVATQTPAQEPANVQTELTQPEHVPTAVPEQKGTITKLNRIYSTTKRIEAVKLALKLEKEQLEQDLQELDRTMTTQQKIITDYMDSLRQEVEKAKTHLTDKENSSSTEINEQLKPDLQNTKLQEPTLENALTQLNAVSNTSKRVQALKTILKSERVQLDQDLQELTKNVEEREKALKNYFDYIRNEINELKSHLAD